MTSVQCCGGCSVHWRLFSTLGDNISTVGIPSVLWRSFSTMGDKISTVGDSFSTVEGIQYTGEITSLHAADNISTVGDNISTVEDIQYSQRKILIWACLAINNDDIFLYYDTKFSFGSFENSSRFHAF